jgi:outer membrane protein TolC
MRTLQGASRSLGRGRRAAASLAAGATALALFAGCASFKPTPPPQTQLGPAALSSIAAMPAYPVVASGQDRAEEKPGDALSAPQDFLIDLPTALRLADAQNPQIQFARQRIAVAAAELDRANVLWLPNLYAGPVWNRHDGQIQRVEGPVITVSRSSLFVGGGPGLRVDLADAYFEPLAARQQVAARVAGERAATNTTLLEVTLGYWDLLRGQSTAATARETLDNVRRVDEAAQAYLKADKLRSADAERVRAEFRARTLELQAATDASQLAGVRLSRLLSLDPFVLLRPAEEQALPITLVDPETDPRTLAALALGNRPELAESQALVRLAQERLRKAAYGPLFPNVILDVRGGGFGGGPNGFFGNFDGRSDMEIGLYWELQNLGFGDHALRRQCDAEVRQTQIVDIVVVDRILQEVAEARIRARSYKLQMETARLAVESAVRSHELSWKLFKDGGIEQIRPIEVLQSIQALSRARQDYLTAVIEYNRAQAQLHYALGNPLAFPTPEIQGPMLP